MTSVVGVLGAEDPLGVGEQRLVDRDRLGHASGVLVGDGEVVVGGERAAMRWAEDPLAISEQLLEDPIRRDGVSGSSVATVGLRTGAGC